MIKKLIIFGCSLLFGQNYIFVHGLKSNADTFFKMAGEFNNTTIKIGIEHFNQIGICKMSNNDINCSEIASNNTLARAYGLVNNFDTKIYFKKFNNNDTNLSMDNATLYTNQKFTSNSFIVNLSNNINLSFEAQGKELKNVINIIKNATNDNNFILIGHSMGGLSIRSYLQYYYDNDVININEVITIATPHQGINYYIPSSIYGASSNNLKSNSQDLQKLNLTNLDVYKKIPFISIVSSGYDKSIFDGDLISGSDDDGVVSVNSQIPPFETKIIKLTDGIYHTTETTNIKIINLVKKYSSDYKRINNGWNLIGGEVESFNLKPLKIAWSYDNNWSYYGDFDSNYSKITHIDGGFWAYGKQRDFAFIKSNISKPLHHGWNMIKGEKNVSDLNCNITWKYKNNRWLIYPIFTGYDSFEKVKKHEGAWCLVN